MDSFQKQNMEIKKTKPVFFYWKMVLVLLIILICVAGYLFYVRNSKPKEFIAGAEYQAVFLDNGQVYFGKIKNVDENFLTLNDVYYIQAGENPKSTNFTMIKMGSELHGPTNEMFISKNHVMFYENLSDDSKVLQSIKKQ